MGRSSAERPMKAIVLMLCAVATFSGMDALLKALSQHYPPMQVVTLRGLCSIPFMLLPLLVTGRLSALKPVRLGMHFLRGVLMILVLGTFVYAVRALSLANAYAIFLAAPLIVTALSVPLLGEHVGWRRWVAVCVGLVGVITMLRPSASNLVSLGAVAALAATERWLSPTGVSNERRIGGRRSSSFLSFETRLNFSMVLP